VTSPGVGAVSDGRRGKPRTWHATLNLLPGKVSRPGELANDDPQPR
jgi:hypothetical protein